MQRALNDQEQNRRRTTRRRRLLRRGNQRSDTVLFGMNGGLNFPFIEQAHAQLTGRVALKAEDLWQRKSIFPN